MKHGFHDKDGAGYESALAMNERSTLDDLLRGRAATQPDKPCITTPGGSVLSYGELDRRASAFAGTMRARGCRPTDRVIVGFSNTPDFFVALFGCFRSGMMAVPVDSNLAAQELQVIVDHAAPAAIFVDDATAHRFDQVRADCGVSGFGIDRQALAHDEEIAAEAPALLLYTSGTTGDPKAVAYSHATLAAKAASIRTWFGFDETYTSLCLLPTHFGHGLICNCLSTLGYGGTLVITPPFNLDLIGKLWSIVDRCGVNTFSSVPSIVRLLNDHARRRPATPPSSLRLVTCASAPLRQEDIELFQANFKVPLLNCYGLTETAGWIACSPNLPGRNLGSVGMALDGQIRAVDPDGQVLAPGGRGELQIKGATVMTGYYKTAAMSGPTSAGGWFATGDFGAVDAGGAVFLDSRIKDLIIQAGKNIHPAEVDGILMSHPDVVEACTVGLPDALLGETVAACVVRRAGSSLSEAELIAHARARLAAYKCPQRIKFIDGIPRTSRGKVRRSQLRPLFEHLR